MSEKMIRVQECEECPCFDNSLMALFCDKTGKKIELGEETFPAGCPLEDTPEVDLTTIYMVGYEKAKDEFKPRWRKFPEEKPLQKGKYLFRYKNKKGREIVEDLVVFDIDSPPHIPFENSLSIEWMPMPEIGGM